MAKYFDKVFLSLAMSAVLVVPSAFADRPYTTEHTLVFTPASAKNARCALPSVDFIADKRFQEQTAMLILTDKSFYREFTQISRHDSEAVPSTYVNQLITNSGMKIMLNGERKATTNTGTWQADDGCRGTYVIQS